jgi:hypothetical protein
MTVYEDNRAKFSIEKLKVYAGQWVAFTLDGTRILAGADSLSSLENRLAAAGVDPEKVALERIEFDDSVIGGAELL